MKIEWITAFVDRPADRFEDTVGFWAAVTGSTVSPWRGAHDEFATLLPTTGADAQLRVQRTRSVAGSHLDLHVADVRAGIDECTAAGAAMVADHGSFATLTTPGGMVFCIVAHHGERNRQQPVPGGQGSSTLVDQVSIDVDPGEVDRESRFWSTLTGWAPVGARAPGFLPLERVAAMPFRLLLQVRDTPSGATGCHLDIACTDRAAAVADHEAQGATMVARHRFWTVMTDPAGAAYCLTDRQPDTGLLADDA